MNRSGWMLAVLILSSTYGMLVAEPESTPAADAAPAVVIATEKSGFKNTVIAQVSEGLQADGTPFRVITLKDLETVDMSTVRAVVILNEIWASRLRKPVRVFLGRLDAAGRSKVILVSTAGDRDWKAQEDGVHAITAASKKANVDGLATQILDQLRKPKPVAP